MNRYRKHMIIASLCCFLVLISGFVVPALAWRLNHWQSSGITYQYTARGDTARHANRPKELIIDALSGNGVSIREGVDPLVRASRGETVGYNRSLFVPAGTENGANLRFLTNSDEETDYLASAGRHPSSSSEYYFPCGASARFVIGWTAGDRSGCDIVSFSPSGATVIGPAGSNQLPLFLAESVTSKQGKNDRRAARTTLRHYCSAIADTGDQWGVSLSKDTWSEEEVAATCQQAIETCEAKGNQECFIAHRGDWRKSHPFVQFRNVDLLLQCDQNREYHSKVSGSAVIEGWEQLESEALAEQASACVLYMYHFDEVLIRPATEQEILIYTDSSETGFEINAILGSVEITVTSPSDTSLRKELLQPGMRYVADYQSETVILEPILPEDRLEIASSPTMISFLDEERWDESVRDDIEAYSRAFREEFLPKPPAISLEQRTVAGISVVVAEIDLDNPDTIFTVSREEDVRNAGGLVPFARRSNAALVLSGTFEDPNNSNWTTISEGSFLEGEQSRDWSTYTVLGLGRDNQPEMLARRNQPQWDAYWFALTGHPRLVNNGVPGVTEVALGSSINIDGPAGRAAIGFSRSPNKLYHVITNTSISLSKMAEVMKAVGCDEAMNLEGGGGYFIVHNEQVYVPGEVRSPVVVVNDAENPPAEATQQAWKMFLEEN